MHLLRKHRTFIDLPNDNKTQFITLDYPLFYGKHNNAYVNKE